MGVDARDALPIVWSAKKMQHSASDAIQDMSWMQIRPVVLTASTIVNICLIMPHRSAHFVPAKADCSTMYALLVRRAA